MPMALDLPGFPEKENQELVSVILTVYNVERWLKKTMESILGQTWKNIEVIAIDDGSKDGSGAI